MAKRGKDLPQRGRKHHSHHKQHKMPYKHREYIEYKLDSHWCVAAGKNPDFCVLMLAGRAMKNNLLPSIYWHSNLQDFRLIGITTTELAWYPIPNGAKDQWSAINGIPHAIDLVEKAVENIKRRWDIPKSRIILMGFSAGGVMAIQVAAYSDEAYAGVVCHSGAILQPEVLPYCDVETPFLLTHSQDDETFEWNERYLPMKSTLKSRSYRISCVESPWGGHTILPVEIATSKIFIRQIFKGIA